MTTDKKTILIFDALTGVHIIREMTPDEIAAITNPFPNYMPSDIPDTPIES